MDEWNGKERRSDYSEDGWADENGAAVKRVTPVMIYRRLKRIEDNQNEICTQLKEQNEKFSEYNGLHEEQEKLRTDLSNHIVFCAEFRDSEAAVRALEAKYEEGRADVIAEADARAEEKLKRIGKVVAVVTGLVTLAMAIITWFMDLWNF